MFQEHSALLFIPLNHNKVEGWCDESVRLVMQRPGFKSSLGHMKLTACTIGTITLPNPPHKVCCDGKTGKEREPIGKDWELQQPSICYWTTTPINP